MVYAPVRIDAPRVLPPRGGLLPVANVMDVDDDRLVGFGAEYLSFLCTGIPGIATQVPCEVGGTPKVPFGPTTVQAERFALYSAVECDLFGSDYDEIATTVLQRWEDKYVGQWLQLAQLIPALGTNIGAAADIVEAVALAEQWAGENYGGLPILHMSRAEATRAIAADVVTSALDGTLTTVQGTPVANSAGYTDDDVIWVTGAVHIWRAPIHTYKTPDPLKNTALGLAERGYAVSIDCIRGYVTIGAEISPDEVTVGSTTVFTISGSGFSNLATVEVNGTPVAATVVDASTITFEYTPDEAGDLQVVVIDGDTTSNTMIVRVQDVLTIVSLSPASASAGEIVTIDGRALSGGTTVTISGREVDLNVIDDRTATFVVPATGWPGDERWNRILLSPFTVDFTSSDVTGATGGFAPGPQSLVRDADVWRSGPGSLRVTRTVPTPSGNSNWLSLIGYPSLIGVPGPFPQLLARFRGWFRVRAGVPYTAHITPRALTAADPHDDPDVWGLQDLVGTGDWQQFDVQVSRTNEAANTIACGIWIGTDVLEQDESAWLDDAMFEVAADELGSYFDADTPDSAQYAYELLAANGPNSLRSWTQQTAGTYPGEHPIQLHDGATSSNTAPLTVEAP